MNDFVIVLLESNEKKILEDYCEKKNLTLYEFCSKAINDALKKEVLI